MPVHEDEHPRESVRCASEHGAGNHFARAGAQTRGGAHSAHARAEQIGRAGTDTRRTEKVCGFYLAKPAEVFAQFCLTKPESVEEDFPRAAFSLFQSGSQKINPPGKEKETLANMKTTTPPVRN